MNISGATGSTIADPSARKLNVLVTGAGAPGAAGIIRCLRRDGSIRIIAADVNPDAVGRFMADSFFTIPAANDPSFIDTLLAICREQQVHCLLPLVTRELIPLSIHSQHFEAAGTRLSLSPANALEIANNKSRLYQFLEWRGLDVPQYRVVENIDQFETAVHELGYPGRAVCFKPSVSNGSRGFRILDSSIDEHRLLFEEKPSAAYITFSEAKRILSLRSFPELLISEFLPGEEYSVDCLASNGESILILPRLRRRIINGISVAGEFVREEQIIGYCSSIIRELRLNGNIGIQVKRAANDKFLLLEINPRVQGTISAALGAGINLPLLAIRQALSLPIPTDDLQVKWGTRFTRFWDESFY